MELTSHPLLSPGPLVDGATSLDTRGVTFGILQETFTLLLLFLEKSIMKA